MKSECVKSEAAKHLQWQTDSLRSRIFAAVQGKWHQCFHAAERGGRYAKLLFGLEPIQSCHQLLKCRPPQVRPRIMSSVAKITSLRGNGP